MEQLECPNCKDTEVDVCGSEIDEEDISCGMMVVRYECECMKCGKYFDAMIHFGIGTIEYLEVGGSNEEV